MSDLPMIKAAELAQHNSQEACWLAIHNKVYDVTSFLTSHPGGAKVLLRSAGQDATKDYESVHNPDVISETLPLDACVGILDQEAFPPVDQEKPAAETLEEENPFPPLSSMINTDDFEAVAKRYLSPSGWAYYSSAADDEYSKEENHRIFRKIKFRPRVLRNVETVDTTTTILGKKSSLPIYISPAGLGKYAHPQAECALAAGAGKEGLIQCVPTSPSMSLESIYNSRLNKDQPIFQQLYVNRDRVKATAFIRKVIDLGTSALWITVDSPVLGKREKDDRLKGETATLSNPGVAKAASNGLLNPALTWSDIKWIRELSDLPIVLKGIQCVEDAVSAHESGVDGIVLSNHGGRSQDTAQPPLHTLLEIHHHAPHLLSSRLQIFLDGSIRRGTDVLKCLALGVTAVGIGRPFLYSMTGGYGEAGVRRLIGILRGEIAGNMALLGARTVGEFRREMVNTRVVEGEVFGSPRL